MVPPAHVRLLLQSEGNEDGNGHDHTFVSALPVPACVFVNRHRLQGRLRYRGAPSSDGTSPMCPTPPRRLPCTMNESRRVLPPSSDGSDPDSLFAFSRNANRCEPPPICVGSEPEIAF